MKNSWYFNKWGCNLLSRRIYTKDKTSGCSFYCSGSVSLICSRAFYPPWPHTAHLEKSLIKKDGRGIGKSGQTGNISRTNRTDEALLYSLLFLPVRHCLSVVYLKFVTARLLSLVFLRSTSLNGRDHFFNLAEWRLFALFPWDFRLCNRSIYWKKNLHE